MAEFAKESGHFYKRTGEPCYTVIGKNGKERNTTLRDCRVMDLVPSVTGIIRMAAAPGLEKWKRNQVLLAALTLPRNPDESEAVWLFRVEQDWREQGRMAADKGTAIHGAIEQFYRDGAAENWMDHVFAADKCLDDICGFQVWSTERSFASPLGYGGKVDLHSPEWVIDVKTKDGSLDKVELYDEHIMQLAAYRRGLNVNDAHSGILFIRRDIPEAKFIEISEDDVKRGLAMFDCLLNYWKAKNGIN